MSQQTTNSSFIINSSGSSNLSALVEPDQNAAVPTETPLPKATPKSKSLARADAPKVAAKEGDRCRHYTAKGRRCRLAVLDTTSGLCFRHVGRQFLSSADEDLSPAFLGLLSGFQSASQIHAFLTQVTVLLVQSRLSTRRAAVLAYLAQILLRTLPAIEHELNPADQEPEIIFDIPRPKRDEPEGSERAMYKRLATLYGSKPTPADSGSPTDLDPAASVSPAGKTK